MRKKYRIIVEKIGYITMRVFVTIMWLLALIILFYSCSNVYINNHSLLYVKENTS